MEKWIRGIGWRQCNASEVRSDSKSYSDINRIYEVFVQKTDKNIEVFRGHCEEAQLDLDKVLKDKLVIYSIKESMGFKTLVATEEFLVNNLDMFNFCRTKKGVLISFMGENIFTYNGGVDNG